MSLCGHQLFHVCAFSFLAVLNISFSHSHANSGKTMVIKGLYSHASVKCPYSTEKNARVMPHPQHSVLRNRLNRHKLSPSYMLSSGIV